MLRSLCFRRCLEFKALIQYPELLVNTLPPDASLEDVEVDSSLSFLNGFVESALAGGAMAYTAPTDVSTVGYLFCNELFL